MIPKLIIFDVDGTLRRCTVERQPCPNTPDEWELIPGVRETLAEFNWKEQSFGIVSNQGGVGLGYMTEEVARNMICDTIVAAFGKLPHPDAIQVCMHAPDADCNCRKPSPTLLRRLMISHLVHPHETLYVGDMESDLKAAENAKCAFMWAKDFFRWPR